MAATSFALFQTVSDDGPAPQARLGSSAELVGAGALHAPAHARSNLPPWKAQRRASPKAANVSKFFAQLETTWAAPGAHSVTPEGSNKLAPG